MELVQDTQRVILTKEMLLEFAKKHYFTKTGLPFRITNIEPYFKWNEKEKSLSIESVINY